MKKLLLLFLAVAGMVTTASAEISSLEFHYNANSDWSGAASYPSFTKIGANPDNDKETIYEYVLNSSTGLGDTDIFFRLHPTGWANDIGAGSNFTFGFTGNANTADYNQWHGEVNWSNTNYWCIPQSSIKASEYKITVYSQENDHYYIKVDIVSMPVTIGSTGKATFCCDRALDFSSAGINAYTITEATKATGLLTTAQKTTVPANTGLYLEGTAGTYNVSVIAPSDADAVGTNMLVGVATDTKIYQEDGSNTNYILTVNTVNGTVDTPKFYKVHKDDSDPDKNGNTVLAGKAYLQIPTANATRESFWFDEEPTSINAVENAQMNGEAYNLAGQRVAQPTKGLYIVNGKKVIK